MDIFHLMDELEDIEREDKFDYPQIYIQIGDIQVPLQSVKYFPETALSYETIILSSEEKPKLKLQGVKFMCNYNDAGFLPQGWQCPICKRVYSPSTTMCYYCGNEKFSVATTTGEATIDWGKWISETLVKSEGWYSRRTKIEDCMEMMRNGWTPVGLEKENEDE